ncbi:MAG: DUF2927 domain-containing protein [Pelagimonas sp.]|jgi:hypothetical protein|nr:DUF2927 domain-containing protein [Pelagimonas sp.]
MNLARASLNLFKAGLACATLAGCLTDTGTTPLPTPEGNTETQVVAAPLPAAPPAPLPSNASLALERYYDRLQANLLSKGLLRRDGGGSDTPFTDTMLARNFQVIALGEEYQRGQGLTRARHGTSRIKKWIAPIRMNTEFGQLVPDRQSRADRAHVSAYTARLSRITGHPIAMTRTDPNFHVLFATHDDLGWAADRIQGIVPDINRQALSIVRDMPRGIHCLVMAFSRTVNGYEYSTAVAVIRAEHPDLLRLSCIHEEIAQGLGVGNDSPNARPSIFNDDDEFALLTRHDEHLLRILYDPRLRPGMGSAQAMPIVHERARALLGGPS